MNNKDSFFEWMKSKHASKSGAISSYVASLEWLSKKFYKNSKITSSSIFDIEDLKLIDELYNEALSLQRDKNSYIYNSDAPSYGDRFYYSASLSKYKEFLLEVKGIKFNTDKSVFQLTKLNQILSNSGLIFSECIINRYTSSLLTKPFVILTGLSGSGKTKLAQAFAMWLCENDTQYKIVPVGADWTNREPLLGFPNGLDAAKYVTPDSGALELIINASKEENQDKPYFLILDEMNLSHVERYFADFLSIMESKEKLKLYSGEKRYSKFEKNQVTEEDFFIPQEIEWPKNLFIIGTVNIDETTYMFSPKVLDRANVIEFRVSGAEMASFLKQSGQVNLESLKYNGKEMGQSFVEIAANKELIYSKKLDLNETLEAFFNQLKIAGAEFGYRTATEISRFAAVTEHLETNWTTTEILDAAIMQKLLPKLHGSRRKLISVLETLIGLCIASDAKKVDYFQPKEGIDTSKVIYPVSLEKLQRMYRGLLDNGFTSYAEA